MTLRTRWRFASRLIGNGALSTSFASSLHEEELLCGLASNHGAETSVVLTATRTMGARDDADAEAADAFLPAEDQRVDLDEGD